MYFTRNKSERQAFEQFLVDVGADGIPSTVKCVRSDSGGEFEGPFREVCRSRGIQQEFNPTDSPELNGVAERAIVLVESTEISTRFQVDELYGEDVSDKR